MAASTIKLPSGTVIATPTLVTGFSVEAGGAALTHDSISGVRSYTFGYRTARTGTMQLLFPSYATGRAAQTQLLAQSRFTLTDDTIGTLLFVVPDAMPLEIDDETRGAWVLTVPWSEVTS